MNDSRASASFDECVVHPSRLATGRCAICGRPLCSECSVKKGKEQFCRGTDHQTIAESWVVINSAASEFEADMVSRNLSVQGVDSRIFSSREYTYTIAWNPDDVVRTYVRRDDLRRAQEILRALDSGDGEHSPTEPS